MTGSNKSVRALFAALMTTLLAVLMHVGAGGSTSLRRHCDRLRLRSVGRDDPRRPPTGLSGSGLAAESGTDPHAPVDGLVHLRTCLKQCVCDRNGHGPPAHAPRDRCTWTWARPDRRPSRCRTWPVTGRARAWPWCLPTSRPSLSPQSFSNAAKTSSSPSCSWHWGRSPPRAEPSPRPSEYWPSSRPDSSTANFSCPRPSPLPSSARTIDAVRPHSSELRTSPSADAPLTHTSLVTAAHCRRRTVPCTRSCPCGRSRRTASERD